MQSGDRKYSIVISDKASEMLVSHARFLAQISESAAQILIRDIKSSMQSLEDYPERNPWLTDNALPANKYRKLLVSKRYLLLYQVKGSTVYIDFVVDCRQDYGWLL